MDGSQGALAGVQVRRPGGWARCADRGSGERWLDSRSALKGKPSELAVDCVWAMRERRVRGGSKVSGLSRRKEAGNCQVGGGLRGEIKSWLFRPFPLKYGMPITYASEGNSLAVQRLGLCASTAGGTGSIPGRGTKIPQAARPKT